MSLLNQATEFEMLEAGFKLAGSDPAKSIPGYEQKKLQNEAYRKSLFINDKRLKSIVSSSTAAPTKQQTGADYWLDKFITQDAEMLKMKRNVRKLAPLSDCVLIQGETGTGKELIARALHHDRQGRFVGLNCGGFPEHLIESELFGHVKGSFTGAIADKEGLFQAAHNGTLFLDEIGELPLLMQTKLLRAIQERTIRRVGDNEETEVNCRIVAATHQNLDEGFRADLYFRLSTFIVNITPIRKRRDDVVPIVRSLGLEINFIGDLFTQVDDEFWLEGNVRELQQYVRRKQVGLEA